MDLTRRWAIKTCKAYFGLTEADERLIAGVHGEHYLQALWDAQPESFYEHPMQLLRQEWFHAYALHYRHPGFWETLSPEATVLDYGCGTAEVTRPWIQRGGETYLYEPSATCRAYLRHKYPYTSVHICGTDLADLPHDVDALVCTDVLEHVLQPMALQRTLWGLLAPGGQALIKMESAYPHPGHLKEAVAEFRPWCTWLNDTIDLVEAETYVWCRKLCPD